MIFSLSFIPNGKNKENQWIARVRFGENIFFDFAVEKVPF